VPDNAPENRFIGRLSTTDSSDSTEHEYTLLDDAGGQTKLIGDELCTAATPILHSAGATRSVTVRSTNATGQTFDKVITFDVAAPVVYAATALNGSTDYYQYAAVIPRLGSWAIFGQFVWDPTPGGTSVEYIYSGGGALAGDNTVHIGVNQPASSTNASKMFARVKSGTSLQQTFTGSAGPALIAGRPYAFGLVRNTGGTQSLTLYLYDLSTQVFTETTIETKLPGAQLVDFNEATAGRAGQRSNGTGSFKGAIHAIQHINGAPDAAQRLQLAAGRPFSELSFTARSAHFFTDAAAATIADLSGNGNTATKVGAPTATTIGLPQRTNAGISYVSLGYNQAFQTTTDGTFAGDSSDDDTAPVWFTGGYFGAPASPSIFMRFVDAVTYKEVVSWTDLGAGSSGSWDKTCNGVPFGRWRPIFRFGNQRLVGAPILVGDVHVGGGQSNQERMNSQNNLDLDAPADSSHVGQHAENFTDPATFVTSFGGFAPAGPGDGTATALTLLRAARGRPQAYLSFARGGSSMGQWHPGGTSPYSTDYNNLKNAINRLTRGLFSTIAFTQGEANSLAGGPGDGTTNSGVSGVGSTSAATTYAFYRSFLMALVDGLKVDLPKYPKSRPWFISNQLANAQVSVSQAAWSDISAAQFQLAFDRPSDVVFGGVRKFVPTDVSQLHLSDYRAPQQLETQARLQAMGLAVGGATGPVGTSFTRTTPNQFRLLVTHSPGGSALSTLSGSNGTGWVQMSAAADFSTQITVTGTAIFDANEITVSTSGDPGGTVYMRVLWGQNPATTDVPIDNFALPNVPGRSIVPTSTQAYLVVS
jgi:hypothetical protein